MLEFLYDVVHRTEMQDGVCLLKVTVWYPICEGEDAGIAHINAFEKRYAETLAEGIFHALLPLRRTALKAHMAQGGRRGRFPTRYVELTGEMTETVGDIQWKYTCLDRCGGEKQSHGGERSWLKNGMLLS